MFVHCTHRDTHTPSTHSQLIIVFHFLVQGPNTVVTPTHSETGHHRSKLLVALSMVPSKCSKVQEAMLAIR